MAEFCLECWNKLNDTEDSKTKYIISRELDLCEGCGEWKPVIVMERKDYYIRKLRYFILPIKIVYYVIYIMWRLVLLPYLIWKYKKSKNRKGKQ